MKKLGLKRGRSLDLDFHTIPFHGEDALVQKHYISKHSRKQKGVQGLRSAGFRDSGVLLREQ